MVYTAKCATSLSLKKFIKKACLIFPLLRQYREIILIVFNNFISVELFLAQFEIPGSNLEYFQQDLVTQKSIINTILNF